MFSKIIILVFSCATQASFAAMIKCASTEPERKWINSLREVVVYLDTNQVGYKYLEDRKYRMVPLLFAEDQKYAFNSDSYGKKNEYNAFRLFYVSMNNNWRVINVGLEIYNNNTILRAGGENTEFICKIE
jgi:hypothetical protein